MNLAALAFLSAFSMFPALDGAGSTSVSGIVSDDSTGHGLPGVTVRVFFGEQELQDKATVTSGQDGQEGRYTVAGLKPGKHKLLFSKAHYIEHPTARDLDVGEDAVQLDDVLLVKRLAEPVYYTRLARRLSSRARDDNRRLDLERLSEEWRSYSNKRPAPSDKSYTAHGLRELLGDQVREVEDLAEYASIPTESVLKLEARLRAAVSESDPATFAGFIHRDTLLKEGLALSVAAEVTAWVLYSTKPEPRYERALFQAQFEWDEHDLRDLRKKLRGFRDG